MDRFDEKKRDRDRIDDDDVTPARSGDILGLGGDPVPKEPGDPSAARDRDKGAGRERGFEDIERHDTTDTPRSSGATGIDMGSGGSGTDVTGR